MDKIAYINILKPEILQDTLLQLDAAVSDLIKTGQAKEEAYGQKGDLLKQKTQLETSIALTESNAVMSIEGSGKDAYAVVGNKKVSITNEETRKAFMRVSSKDDRNQLAECEGALQKVEIALFKATDAWQNAQYAANKIEAKAKLQAGLLNFLANEQ